MRSLRRHLSYGNVMSTLFVFLVLGGATAFAATQLAKNSVGTKQLRKNAVTAAKIKKNAVTKAKIKNSAVNGAKIAQGSVTGSDIDLGSTPFSRVVARFRGSGTVGLSNVGLDVYPLSSSTFTQGAEELNSYAGAISVTYAPTCVAPRSAAAYVLLDPANPAVPTELNVVGAGIVTDETGASSTQRIEIGPYLIGGTRFEPGEAKAHTVSLVVGAECESGSGATASNGAVDLIGTK